ncbi:MAG: aminotransferase class V-fold PLP-dependent enzyme [Alphaproteobacteria bacterium]|jgi:cysteine desulfurase|nr:aminotransferase class V-fold PLP-dependent enzyme [Alphaproteobacteria bacterium]
MPRALVYCDYNAGAPIRPAALAALADAAAAGGNPSSVHGAGRSAKALLEDARETLAWAVGAQAANVVFTSGATEALHAALAASAPASIVLSPLEHDAVWEQALLSGLPIALAAVGGDGVIDLAGLEEALTRAPKPALAAIMLANNETGVIQPVAQAAAIARMHGAMLLVDAAQALGRLTVDMAALDATYLAVSSYKIGGPAGVGALILAPGAPFKPPRAGGGQERGRRPGTENIAGAAGFAVAVREAADGLKLEAARLAELRACFESGLDPGFRVVGAEAPRLCNTSLVVWPGLKAETAVISLDLAGLAVSSGAACSSGKVRASRVLQAMGLGMDCTASALRVSFGWGSRFEDAKAAAAALNAMASRQQRRVLEGAE